MPTGKSTSIPVRPDVQSAHLGCLSMAVQCLGIDHLLSHGSCDWFNNTGGSEIPVNVITFGWVCLFLMFTFV